MKALRPTGRRPARRAARAALALAVLAAPACGIEGHSPATGHASNAVDDPAGRATAGAWLQAAPGGDGDSWRDTNGREYRLGLVDTPEVGECYAEQASRRRRSLVAHGFRAQVYGTDRYGRAVSVVTTADDVVVNVALARGGFADDRYLASHRQENPQLADALDLAFAAARRHRAGLWSACRSTPAGA